MNQRKPIVRPLRDQANAFVATLTEEECYEQLDLVGEKLKQHPASDKWQAMQVALQTKLRSIK